MFFMIHSHNEHTLPPRRICFCRCLSLINFEEYQLEKLQQGSVRML